MKTTYEPISVDGGLILHRLTEDEMLLRMIHFMVNGCLRDLGYGAPKDFVQYCTETSEVVASRNNFYYIHSQMDPCHLNNAIGLLMAEKDET
jgi:hypothetical protein